MSIHLLQTRRLCHGYFGHLHVQDHNGTHVDIPIFCSRTDVFNTHLLYRYVTLSNIQSNASVGLLGNTTFISAGAVKPSLAEDTDANQCSLGELYRIGKRGGPFIATNADIPGPAIYVRLILGLLSACATAFRLHLG